MITTIAPPKHRLPGLPKVLGYGRWFKPKHCAGESCFHVHAEETRIRWCCPSFLDQPHTEGCQQRQVVSA